MNRQRLEELMNHWRDGCLTEVQASELNLTLRESEEARRFFRAEAQLHGLLHCVVAAAAVADASAHFSPHPASTRTTALRSSNWLSWRPLAVAAVVLIGLASWWLASLSIRRGAIVARFGALRECRWVDAKTMNAPGDEVHRGQRLELSSGRAALVFGSGAVATLMGPCIFEVESANGGFLLLGQMKALADTPASKGFTAHTRTAWTARVVDLGTEFVMSASADGQSRVEVTSGEVDVHLAGVRTPQRLRKGDTLSVEAGCAQVMARIESRDETAAFRFPTILPPANTDYADASRGVASVSLVGGPLLVAKFDKAFSIGGVDRLVDGRAQGSADAPLESAFFEDGTLGGFLFDLSQPVAISKINSYSWHSSLFRHENRVRATQNYTPWGFAGDEPPNAVRPSAAKGSERIARVNTDEFFEVSVPTMRPAQQGTSISAQQGKLGSFRFLLFEVYPTSAAHDNDLDHTFYGEIDVYA